MNDPRPARSTDRPAVEAIVHAAYSPWIDRIGQTPGPMLDDYAALIAEGRVHVTGTPDLTGILVLIPEADTLLLDNIAVAPEAQGTGVGKRLMTFAEDQARAAGYDRIRLYTHEGMAENVAIYLRVGYRETHRATQNGFPRVFMEKVLT